MVHNEYSKKLTLMSFAIIIYFLADGSITERGQIHLQAISITADRPCVIFVAAWVILAWFILQFFIDAQFSISERFYKLYRQYLSKEVKVYRLLYKHTGLSRHEVNSANLATNPTIGKHNGQLTATLEWTTDTENPKPGNKRVLIPPPIFNPLFLTWALPRSTEIREFLVPPTMAFIAVLVAIVHAIPW